MRARAREFDKERSRKAAADAPPPLSTLQGQPLTPSSQSAEPRRRGHEAHEAEHERARAANCIGESSVQVYSLA